MKEIPVFAFDPHALDALAEQHGPSYRKAEPFPHIVLDGFLPGEAAENLLREFPGAGSEDWIKFQDQTANKKRATRNEQQLGAFTRQLIGQFHSSTFMRFLEKLTGIEGLIPDPHLEGGGLHEIIPGGFLKIHADFNWYPKLRLDRRLNLLLYLNKDWKEEYGGALELWSKDMTHCEKKLLPLFNRCAVFSTTDFSFHGHPEPLRCPPGTTRKSLALYYYSNGRPAEEISAAHATLYQTRPQEFWTKGNFSWKSLLRKMTPPLLLEFIRYLKSLNKKDQ